ncbi:hypothetical protein HK103_006558 [Boothiomyces macroporosus]|uniref:Uncharacterized protein n=1 Tax=Boothiomyces macroporosus TaxID=261099 RepID=A0AAD5Y706_9FUNG|nr:hypothetical protein HK103_006558 [Boothiomyces macroporosus]
MRNEVGGKLKSLIDELQQKYSEEFTVHPIEDPEDMESALEELQEAFPDNNVKFPLGVFEYIWQTYNAEPSSTANFGIPTFPLTNSHASNKVAWTDIELDFDEELYNGELKFVVCVDVESKNYGKVCIINSAKKVCKVAESFEEFFNSFTRMMVDDFGGSEEEQAEIIKDFYEQYNL